MRLEIDDLVVKEGELSREIYVVLDGSAEVYVKWTLPDRTRVGTVSKGAIFGEIEMLAHIDNPECELTHQPGPEFGRLLNRIICWQWSRSVGGRSRWCR